MRLLRSTIEIFYNRTKKLYLENSIYWVVREFEPIELLKWEINIYRNSSTLDKKY
ncbi:hypothetical protein OCEANICA350_20045 [Oceanicaulis sp. 350]|nr:hypothetical protein OCEANICA350_20045 [Oceanicaulis sp. 350]